MAKHKAAMGDQLFQHRVTFDENMASMEAAHFHNNYEIYYLEHANCKVSYLIDRNIYTVSEGDLILVPPQSLHRVMYTDFKGDRFSRYLLSFKSNLFPADLESAFDIHHYQLSPEDRETVSMIMKNIGEEYALFDKFFTRMYKQYLSSLLVLLVRKYTSADKDPLDRNSNRIEQVIQKIINYIHKNIGVDISLAELSEKYGYSKEYISSQFKLATGCGFNEYLNKTRIAFAVKMLISTQRPIKFVAMKSGFKNSNYFAAVFRSYMNMSPSKYRKLHHNAELPEAEL